MTDNKDFWDKLDLTPVPECFNIERATELLGEKYLDMALFTHKAGAPSMDALVGKMTELQRASFIYGTAVGEFRLAGLVFAEIAGRHPNQKDFDRGVKTVREKRRKEKNDG